MIIRNNFQINNLIYENDIYIIFCDNKISIYDVNLNKKDYDLPGKIIGGYNFKNSIIFYTEKIVYKVDSLGNHQKICDKKSMDLISIFNDQLLIINEKTISFYNIDSLKIKDCTIIDRGICVKSVIWNNELFLGFENGSILILENINNNNEIIKMNESITSFDVRDNFLCIGFFDKKISISDLKGNNFKYTKIKFSPKYIKFWKMYVLCLDEENNLFLLDNNLNILYIENFENNLSFFNIFNDLLFLVYKDGTVIVQKDIKDYIN